MPVGSEDRRKPNEACGYRMLSFCTSFSRDSVECHHYFIQFSAPQPLLSAVSECRHQVRWQLEPADLDQYGFVESTANSEVMIYTRTSHDF